MLLLIILNGISNGFERRLRDLPDTTENEVLSHLVLEIRVITTYLVVVCKWS